MASAATSLDDVLRAAAYHFDQNRPLILMEIHLLLSALFPIYAGAHASLSRPSSAAKSEKHKRAADGEDDEEEDDSAQTMEGLSPRDAIIFPLTAGVILGGLYFIIKAYGADMINVVLGLYFSLIGTYSVGKLISDSWSFLQSFVTPNYYRDNGKLWKLVGGERKAVALVGDERITSRSTPLPGLMGRVPLPAAIASSLWSARDLTTRKYAVKGFMRDQFDFKAVLTQHNVLSTLLGITAVGYALFVDKPWWLTNLQGFAVSYGALQMMSPTTFATGTLILSGLFFYDIWAVFFTPLMVTVAKNLDVPIKLVFPRPGEPTGPNGERSYSMLGLGDIVLPGLMIAFSLRFDLYMFYLRKQKTGVSSTDGKSEVVKAPYIPVTGQWGDKFWTFGKTSPEIASSFPKPYFHATIVGYVIGMLFTLGFMAVFQHAQPALLYLVPCVLASVWGTGLVRGELKRMWEFTEAVNGEAVDEEQDQKNGNVEDQTTSSESFLSTFWNTLFGTDKSKTSQPAKTEKQAKSKENGPKKEPSATSKEKQNASKGADDSTFFRIEISHHPSKSENSTTKARELEEIKKAGKGIDLTDSDDTVLVSSADFDDAKDVVK